VLPILRNRRTFAVADAGLPDGVKLDSKGNVYVGTGAGVEVFAASGQRLGTVFIPGGVANLVFGGDKKDVLFALAEKKILGIKMKLPGAELP
jgi:gluconolactonase